MWGRLSASEKAATNSCTSQLSTNRVQQKTKDDPRPAHRAREPVTVRFARDGKTESLASLFQALLPMLKSS
jgi:hypothetical protein